MRESTVEQEGKSLLLKPLGSTLHPDSCVCSQQVAADAGLTWQNLRAALSVIWMTRHEGV